tara:strand:- start:1049 stop:1669 length:621 start_codon:yes stop_codon:yes gene_type:complete
MTSLNKGAMFGIDARIALAIFGALSVISGAALYSAIQQAKTIQTSATFNELSKAVEAYYIDTGSPLPENTPSSNTIYLGNLYSNYANVSGWNGPYFGTASPNQFYLQFDVYGINRIYGTYRHTKADWGSTLATVSPGGCTSTDCYIYVYHAETHATNEGASLENYFNNLDREVDNSDGPGLGKVRARITGVNFAMYYQIFPEYHKM